MATMNASQYTEQAELLKALAHPVRLCIVRGLSEMATSCNVSYLQECLSLPQSTVSQHLQKLRAAGIIEAKRQGLEVYYQVKNETVRRILPYLFETTS